MSYKVHPSTISTLHGSPPYDGQQDPFEQVTAELECVRDWPIHISPNHPDVAAAKRAYGAGLRELAELYDPQA